MNAIRLISKNIYFETASLLDVNFIHFCRSQKKNKDFLNKPKSIIDHIQFLKKEMYDERSEYFIIHENITGKKIGLIRISEIDKINKSFSWGSWSTIHGAKSIYAIESAFMIYEYFFNIKKFSKCYFNVNENNRSVINFHTSYGSRIIYKSNSFISFEFLDADFHNINSKFSKYMHSLVLSTFEKANFFIHDFADVATIDIKDGCIFWQFSVVCQNSKLGRNVKVNSGVFIDNNVTIGNNVTIKNNSLLYSGVNISDNVFIGPNVVFTNDKYMKSVNINTPFKYMTTYVGENSSIGANVTILPGLKIGKNCVIGAGSIITKDIEDNSTVYSKVLNIIK